MDILLLYSGYSKGIRNYSNNLIDCSKLFKYNVLYAGDELILKQQSPDDLVDHYLQNIIHSTTSTVHLQYDSMVFKGNGDDWDGFEAFVRFIKTLNEKRINLVVTFHGEVFRYCDGTLQWLLRRCWLKTVIPALKETSIIVHSESHKTLLESQGCDNVYVQLPPLVVGDFKIYSKDSDEIIKIVVPGKDVDRKDWWSITNTLSSLPDQYHLYVSSDIPGEVYHQISNKDLIDRVHLIEFNDDYDEYISQLKTFDIGLVLYKKTPPLSGVVDDCMKAGVFVVSNTENCCALTKVDSGEMGRCKIIFLGTDYEFRNAVKNSIHDQVSRRDPSTVNSKYLELYTTGEVAGDWKATTSRYTLIDQPDGKINLSNQPIFTSHRSGWSDVIGELADLHNINGVMFDGFLERNFFSKSPKKYKQPWVGVLHNPHNMPRWFNYSTAPQQLLNQAEFQYSLKNCKGLYAMSEYHAEWMRSAFNVPVETLYHPVIDSGVDFDWDEFVKNEELKLVNIGWWLRKLTSIDRLTIPESFQKLRLIPYEQNSKAIETINSYVEYEITTNPLPEDVVLADTKCAVPDSEYDSILSKNIVFVDFWDSSANNTVTECIARGTPLIVNKHPAVVEYIGEGYPLYFNNLEDVCSLLLDLEKIREAHEWLVRRRGVVDINNFKTILTQGDIYQSL